MRLGGEVFGWKTAEEWAQCHVRKGFGAAVWPLPVNASALDEADFVSTAAKHDLVIAEVGIWNNLFDPYPEKAKNNIAYSIARMKQADRVGARCCVNCSGSLSTVWDGPHAGNLTAETFSRIVALTKDMLKAAGLKRSYYTLEPMPWMYPIDTASMQALLDAVDDDRFAVHVDMVNMINSPEKIFRTGELVREFFGAFRSRIRSVHVKDLTIDNTLTVYMPEVLCGKGLFDLRELLRQASQVEDVPFMLEHLPDEASYDAAAAHILSLADELHLPFDTAR